jgi:hypothetical protein
MVPFGEVLPSTPTFKALSLEVGVATLTVETNDGPMDGEGVVLTGWIQDARNMKRGKQPIILLLSNFIAADLADTLPDALREIVARNQPTPEEGQQ